MSHSKTANAAHEAFAHGMVDYKLGLNLSAQYDDITCIAYFYGLAFADYLMTGTAKRLPETITEATAAVVDDDGDWAAVIDDVLLVTGKTVH